MKSRLAKTNTVLVIQHDERNAPGVVADIPCHVIVHRSDLDPEMPSLDGVDGLIVLGGPMCSFDDDGFPARGEEIELLKTAVSQGIPVLGICLGAQLLAVALGARTYRREHPEIGFLPVHLSPDGKKDPLFLGCPSTFAPRHRHRDSFELPENSVRLASSTECAEQGFRFGNRAWGLQFHFEMEPKAKDVETGPSDVRTSILALAPTAQKILSNFCSIVSETAQQKVRTAS
jgi:GMP synthase-like glutamine amidotransferase